MAGNLAKHSKLVPLSLAIAAAFAGIGSYATAAADPLPYGPDTCIQGFVWQDAQPGDVVCVTPAVRSQAANAPAPAPAAPPPCALGPNPLPRFIPNGGPFC
jgi:hypothetical protein